MAKATVRQKSDAQSWRAWASGALILASSLALGGCTTYHQEVGGGFSDADLSTLGAGTGIPLQVDGSVGGVSGAKLAAAVSTAMPSALGASNIHYRPCEPYTECSGDHVVWTFGPTAARPASNYPAALHVNLDWFGTYHPGADHVSAKVALFQGGNVVASADGQVDAPQGADDPAFKAMIAEMSAAVMESPGWFD
jgi:hypothetical protein